MRRQWLRGFAGLALAAAASPCAAQTDDSTPLAASAEATPIDPCEPQRRISAEFGAAFAGLEGHDPELASDGNDPALAQTVGPPPWQAPPAAGLGPAAEPFLASHLLPTARTSFDRQWRQVRDVTVSSACATMLTGLAPQAPSLPLLQAINRWVNHTVRYVDDGPGGDRWAEAPATLRSRVGDCEDLAIAKLQLLAALGMPYDAMYLTLVRDLIRRTDHAVLVVRIDGEHWMLDDPTDRLLDAAAGNDYQPMLSFSAGRKWLHGR